MKLLKKLLPITTIASAALVVTPCITSCSKGVTSFDWKPKYQKDATSIEISFDDLTNYASISREYFEDKQSKYFIEDMYYTSIQSVKAYETEKKAEPGVSDVKTSFNCYISDLNLTQKNAKVPGIEKEIYGYLLSFKINTSITFNFKKTEQGTGNISSIERQINETMEASVKLQNLYACLMPSANNKFEYYFFANDEASKEWSEYYEYKLNVKSKNTFKFTDGSTSEDESYGNEAYSDTKTYKKGEKPSTTSSSSYYLEKVTYTIKS